MRMFDNLKIKLASNSSRIDFALSSYLQVDNCESVPLNDAQRYSLIGGGKKIRAYLVMELCRILGGDEKNALPYACAIEMMHASSLIHDDMPCMDNDDYRRGKLATHKAFGEAAALLSGDSLMIKAFYVIANNSLLSPEVNLKAVSELSCASGDKGMLAGQGIDVLSDGKTNSLDELIRLHQLKTGQLISVSAKLGCLAANISENDQRYGLAVSYAENLGLAFQIIDDMIDFKEGKNEENSFLSFMDYDSAEKYANECTEKAIDMVAAFDDGTLTELAKYLTVREY